MASSWLTWPSRTASSLGGLRHAELPVVLCKEPRHCATELDVVLAEQGGRDSQDGLHLRFDDSGTFPSLEGRSVDPHEFAEALAGQGCRELSLHDLAAKSRRCQDRLRRR